MFCGLLAPGNQNLAVDEDLVVISRDAEGLELRNYQAKFTVLDVEGSTTSQRATRTSGTTTCERGSQRLVFTDVVSLILVALAARDSGRPRCAQGESGMR